MRFKSSEFVVRISKLLLTKLGALVLMLALLSVACTKPNRGLANDDGVLAKTGSAVSHKPLSMATVDAQMSNFSSRDASVPVLNAPLANLENQELFSKTQTGSYVSGLSQIKGSKRKINNISRKILTYLYEASICRERCTEEFTKTYTEHPEDLSARLSDVAAQSIANEIPNAERFMTYYYGFPNEFRLHQDVLRAIKSFEFLRPLRHTYLFRDFAFDDEKVKLTEFLQNWLFEYKKYMNERKWPLYSVSGANAEFTIYPDRIGFAQKYLISTNVNFFGNAIIPLSNSVFFFVNSSSATGLSIVDLLIEQTLSSYIKLPNGKQDKLKFHRVLFELKNAFNRHMSKSGGQLAQIFLRNDVATEISFLAWSGGRPIWFSRHDRRMVFENSQSEQSNNWVPLNILWPTAEQSKEIFRPDIAKFMQVYVQYPATLAYHFPILNLQRIKAGGEFLGEPEGSQRTKEFLSRDAVQARILPDPKYLADENVSGARIYTLNQVSDADLKSYEDEVYAIVHSVVSDFLATAQASDFKPGHYPLKSLFLSTQESRK